MAEIAKIVFPTDFSDLSLVALPWVHRMAEILKAEVHCVYAIEEPHVYATLDMGPALLPAMDEFTETAKARMSAFTKEHLKEFNQEIVGEILPGRPADEIVRYAGNIGAEMIIMTTHGYSGLKHALLGSTTEVVLRRADCPVLSIPAGSRN